MMIDELFAVLVVDEKGNESIYAQDTGSIYGKDGPTTMQAASSNKGLMELIFGRVKERFPERQFTLARFIRHKEYH